MTDWTIILQALNTIILIVLGFFLYSYLPKYFEKKGENRAVKEDTGEITGIDESVRSAIAEIRSQRDTYLHDQKTCLLRFYDLLIDFYYEKLTINFGDFPIDQGQSLATFQSSFFVNVSEIMKSYQRIVLYFDNQASVRIHAENALNQVLNARVVMKKHFGKVKICCIDENLMWVSGNKSKADEIVEAANIANRAYWDAMNPITAKLSDSLRLYLTSLNEFLHPGEFPNIPKGMFSKE
ncbi:MAG: hypothetical protein IMZ53_16200 [Thermoplasmata archaeon]|nr:hypothetical protein [Thermoplasmata archaeon]